MATTLDGTTLADPVSCPYEDVPIGSVIERADGSSARRTTNATGHRRVWSPRWEGITAAQLSTLRTEWEDALQAAVNWSPPDQAGTISVIADGALQYEPRWLDGAWHYNVSGGRLIEASP
jgi:hypothetical protein